MSTWPTAATRLLALVGAPVRRSLSPEMHNAALRRRGLDLAYVALGVKPERADGLVAALRTLGVAGANLTVPYKERVLPHLDALAPSAQRAGSVNTITSDGERLVGHNTDGDGLLDHLAWAGRPPVRRAVVLGAGGTGRSVCAALVARGGSAVLLNRTVSRAEAVAAALPGVEAGPLTPTAFARAADGADLVVHCTAGGSPRVLSLDPSAFGGHTWVDVNYWQAEPPHRAALRSRGVAFEDGLGMLAFQGALSLTLWVGEPIPGAELLDTLRQHRAAAP